jgi:pimeloyl-ACP methyl ester carboxylesterase
MSSDSKKIYILHGWAYTNDKWSPFVQELEKLGFEVVLLHIPGLTAPLDKSWTLNDYISWLYDTLKKEKEPVILLGHSNGGRIALAFSACYPEKVQQLILLDSAGVYHTDFRTSAKRVIFGTLAKFGQSLKKIESLRRLFYKIVGEQDYRDANPIMQQTMRNLISINLVGDMSNVKCPTLLIWGELDMATPLSDGKIMEEKIPKSELRIISGARHSPHFTHVKETTDAIRHYYEKKNL